jgi:hypothetical protein
MERKGFLVFYANLPEKVSMQMDDYIELIRRTNKGLFEMSEQDGYPVMIFPVFNEACRVEKVDLPKGA